MSEETIKHDVGAVILALETLVAENIAHTLAPVAPSTPSMIRSAVGPVALVQ